MQISGQNNNINPVVQQPQYNSSYNCGTAAAANGTQAQAAQPAQQQATQPVYPQGYYYPQGVPLPQSVPPVTSGVNIQIINPAVNPNPTTNVNSPIYYPGDYYTGQIGPTQPAQYPQQPVPTNCPQCPPPQVPSEQNNAPKNRSNTGTTARNS